MLQRILFSPTLLSLLLLLLCASYSFCDPLVNFQVAQPPPFTLDPTVEAQCTVLVLQPPTDCGTPNDWSGITLNFTVTSMAPLYDHIGIFTFQNVESLSISYRYAARPDEGDGVRTYLKDVTRFVPLFSKPGTFIFHLNNVGSDGEYATTLEATFFASSKQFPPAPRADLIVPLTLASNTGDAASVPPGFSLSVTLPRNAVTAFAELQACANGDDEYWYYNAPNDFLSYLPPGQTNGNGPFREVRVLVDGRVAGVAFPYPVMFTGNEFTAAWRYVLPLYHRAEAGLKKLPSPISSHGSADMPTYHIDLTPFIPILTDGKPHTITLDVASAELNNHQINQRWFVSGLLQVTLDSSEIPTTGNITVYEASDFATLTSASADASGVDRVTIELGASRRVHIEAEIIAGSGARTEVVFTQDMEYEHVQNYFQDFATMNLFRTASGEVLSKHNGEIALQDTFLYPLAVNITSSPDGSGILMQVDHSYDRVLLPAPFILGTTIVERQFAGGLYTPSSYTSSNGTSNNTFNYVDTKGNTYKRQASASSNVITFDNIGGSLAASAAT
ncbi:peptide N-acetyl-beta-D-glucosaminyl asparaginase amidase A-domain-containing protein [Lactarius psammicola]|nr:peptide N-acetyl-beta-D-glucosaminyl asparaginase amidase A-domain-containing protein [Lactarius psammicola]